MLTERQRQSLTKSGELHTKAIWSLQKKLEKLFPPKSVWEIEKEIDGCILRKTVMVKDVSYTVPGSLFVIELDIEAQGRERAWILHWSDFTKRVS